MTETFRLEHGIRAPSQARHWIVQRCHDWDCVSLADSAALMTSELVTNVFLHARTDCTVDASYDEPTLTVSVTDQDGHQLAALPPSATAEEGRGLAIVSALADAWGVEHRGGAKRVWFSLSP